MAEDIVRIIILELYAQAGISACPVLSCLSAAAIEQVCTASPCRMGARPGPFCPSTPPTGIDEYSI
jgi:hypothetical protein